MLTGPLVDDPCVEFLGEVGDAAKSELIATLALYEALATQHHARIAPASAELAPIPGLERFLVALPHVGATCALGFRVGVAANVAEALPLLPARFLHRALIVSGGRTAGRVGTAPLAEPAGALASGLLGNLVALHDRVASGWLIGHAGQGLHRPCPARDVRPTGRHG